jgi:hypothetical protein
MTSFKNLICICFIFFIGAASGDVNTISWRDNYKLQWHNFKGEPKQNTDVVAVTASGITFGYSVKTSNSKIISFSSSVEAHFYPKKSWYHKERADTYILAHEQLHFDITELHVRKLRKLIAQLEVSQNLRNLLNQLHQNSNAELAEMQNKYDTESNNSINKDSQTKWILFVKKELQRYEVYKSKD